jgi:hypothetical protein
MKNLFMLPFCLAFDVVTFIGGGLQLEAVGFGSDHNLLTEGRNNIHVEK